MLTIHMFGLMYFHGCRAVKKMALLPYGLTPDFPEGHPNHIPPHYASVWIKIEKLDDDKDDTRCDWSGDVIPHDLEVDGQLVTVHEFRIPAPALVTFSDKMVQPAQFDDFENRLPRLENIDPLNFIPNLTLPPVIARVPIRGGQLEAFLFGEAASVKWTIAEHPVPFVINAGGSWIEIDAPNKEIVFSHSSDLVTQIAQYREGREAEEGPDHFYLYEKLAKSPRDVALVPPVSAPKLPVLVYQHPYLKYLYQNQHPRLFPEPGCTPTCCG